MPKPLIKNVAESASPIPAWEWGPIPGALRNFSDPASLQLLCCSALLPSPQGSWLSGGPCCPFVMPTAGQSESKVGPGTMGRGALPPKHLCLRKPTKLVTVFLAVPPGWSRASYRDS